MNKFEVGDIVEFRWDIENIGITKGDKAVIVSKPLTRPEYWRVTMIEERGMSNTKNKCGAYDRLLFKEDRFQLCSSVNSQSVVNAVSEGDGSNQSLIALFKPASYPCPICGSPGTPSFNDYWCSNRSCENG